MPVLGELDEHHPVVLLSLFEGKNVHDGFQCRINPPDDRHPIQQLLPELDHPAADVVGSQQPDGENQQDESEDAEPGHVIIGGHQLREDVPEDSVHRSEQGFQDEVGPPNRGNHQQPGQKVAFERRSNRPHRALSTTSS